MYVPSFFPFGHGKRVGTPTLSNRLRILLVVLALLVGNGAGGLAGRLTRGLALAAAAVGSALLQRGAVERFDMGHGISPLYVAFG